jgi:predicted enzyme related to lactoylglutathione lyase
MSEQQTRDDAVAWFEIPARDFAATVAFYETVLGTALRREAFGGGRLAVFPYAAPGVGGAVQEVAADSPRPAGTGPLVYLRCDGALAAAAARVAPAGGRLAGPLVELPPGMGRFVHVLDPEGNRVGLHQR